MEKILITGGGVAGLITGHYLCRRGQRPVIIEKDSDFGGLHQSIRPCGRPVEKFYHHLMKTDKSALEIFSELGLKNHAGWHKAKSAFFLKKSIRPFSGPFDAISTDILSTRGKLEYLTGFIKIAAGSESHDLLSCPVLPWTKSIFGDEAYEKLWKPLILGRWGEFSERIPAIWLWWRLKKRISNMGSFFMQERLFYPKGGYGVLIKALENEILSKGGKLYSGVEALEINKKENSYEIKTTKGVFSSKKLVLALPFGKIPGLLNFSKNFIKEAASLNYMGAINLVIASTKSLIPCYWMNISEKNQVYCGIIEHTNLVGRKSYNGLNIIYLAGYYAPSHSIWKLNDADITELFLSWTLNNFPDFKRENIVDLKLVREKFASPVRDKAFLKKMENLKNPEKGLHIVNDSLVFPDDRGLDACAVAGQRTAERIAAGY